MKLTETFKKTVSDFLHIFYPHNCIGCGSDVLQLVQLLCSNCFQELPFTCFENSRINPVEKTFRGRISIDQAAAVLFFTKHSVVQKLMFELKYRNHKQAGIFLGRLLGNALNHSPFFKNVDLLIPMPLNEKRLKQRGYNQADVLIEGIQERIPISSSRTSVIRSMYTQTQTHKDRTKRWQSMQSAFSVAEPETLRNKHILIVDDVITTGATIEAMVNCIRAEVGCTVSVIAAAWTSQ
jgi:ComF family protein